MGRNNRRRRAAKARARLKQPAGGAHHDPAAAGGSSVHRQRPCRPGQHGPTAATEAEAIAAEIETAVSWLRMRPGGSSRLVVEPLLRRDEAPSQRRVVIAQLGELLRAGTSRALASGWRPLDLHQLVGRRLDAGAQAVMSDAVVAYLSGYAQVTLAESWPGQLREIGAKTWWPASSDALTARIEHDSGGFESVVRCALRVIAELSWLPAIQAIDPLPGTARPRRRGRAPVGVDERVLERVRALLAKAESTPYEAEADTFSAAAQKLMARHSIDHVMLAADRAQPDKPDARRVWIDRPYEHAKVSLLHAVASANRSRAVWTSSWGFVTIVGHATDLAAVETLFTSLLVQASSRMTREGPRRDGFGASRTRAFRQSFLMAYADRIGQRLREAADLVTQEAVADDVRCATGAVPGADESGQETVTTGGTLVRILADRQGEVDDRVNEMFPRLTTSSARSATDLEGWVAGTAAADAARLVGGGELRGA